MAGRFWWVPLAIAAIAALLWGDAGALPAGVPGPREPLGKLTDIASYDNTVRAGLPEDRAASLAEPPGLPREAIVELASRAARGARGYTFAGLNAISNEELVALLVTIDWWEIDGLFEMSSDSEEFYADSTRVLYLIGAIEDQGALYTTEDEAGLGTLVEVVRSGFYLGFYHSELSYLNTERFKQHAWPAMNAIADNPAFGLGTEAQDAAAAALGALMNIGSAPVEVVNKVAPLIDQFAAGADTYLWEWSKTNALWWLGSGVDYALVGVYLYWHPDPWESPYWTNVDDYFEATAGIALHGSLDDDYEWVLNNAVWWVARVGLFVGIQEPVQVLTDVIAVYGQWPAPSVWAAECLVWYYGGVDANGDPMDIDQLKVELHAILLPCYHAFDDSTIVFNTGDEVDEEKVEKLYWAIKEVKAQFHRMVGSDAPLEPENADSVLVAVVYDSRSDYQYNSLLYGLSTSNGGMYIESWGTFFTYERKPEESIYTLEDLFRHEYVHYLQGRYLVPGLWGASPIYDNERLTWLEEGMAEFLAGSSRDEGVKTRRRMVENIASEPSDRMTLEEVLGATYASGFEFYTYACAFFDYVYKERMDVWFDLRGFVLNGNGNGFDNTTEDLLEDSALRSAYRAHLTALVGDVESFEDPETSDDYLAPIPIKDATEILLDIIDVSGIDDASVDMLTSEGESSFRVSGNISGQGGGGEVEAWANMDSLADAYLVGLSALDWYGYKTVTCYFADIEEDARLGIRDYEFVFQGILGNGGVTGVPERSVGGASLELSQNTPNPFASATTIAFTLSAPSHARVSIYDCRGRLVTVLVDREHSTGKHILEWRGHDGRGNTVANGVYFCRVETEGAAATQKMIHIR